MSRFDDYIQGSKKILLITSQPLDADCISSGLVMKRYLEHLGLDVTFRFPRELTQEEIAKHNYMPLFSEFTHADTRTLLADSSFDTIILLDGTNLIQFYDYTNRELPEPVLEQSKKIIQIDHHSGEPEKLANLQIKDKTASSTIEIILAEIVPHDFLDKDLATLAYTGLVGDTGNFRWGFTSTTLSLAAMLLAKGVDATEAIEHMFSMKDKNYIEGLKYVLENIEYDDELSTIFLFLPFAKLKNDKIDVEKFRSIEAAFLEAISKNIAGYARGIIVSEFTSKKSLKIRGKGSNLHNKISLSDLWKTLGGNGGGHFHSAAMEIEADFAEFTMLMKREIKKSIALD